MTIATRKDIKESQEIINQLLAECIAEEQAVNIPIRNDLIECILFDKVGRNHAECRYVEDDNGTRRYRIYVHEKFIQYHTDEHIIAIVKNDVYHELLHTIDGINGHRDEFIKWSQYCDGKLGTRSGHFTSTPMHHHPKMKPKAFYKCGSEYWASREIDFDCSYYKHET